MNWVHDQGVVQGYLADASNISGHAGALVRPIDAREVSEVLKQCVEQNTPVTVSGARTRQKLSPRAAQARNITVS